MATSGEALQPKAGAREGISRLAVGLLQGLALYLLYSAADAKSWPATDGLVFAPLLFVSLFIPLIVSVSVGSVRTGTLIVWAAIAALIVAGFAWYDIWHDMPLQWIESGRDKPGWAPHIIPSFGVLFFAMVGLFIGQSLITGVDAEHRVIASYPAHFDVAWKLAVQLVLTVAFVGVFWGLLELGSELFALINIQFFAKLIVHDWFAIPVTALATAAAIHLTDVRAALVRGARTLVLVLLAWLLPLMVVIIGGFLASLIFTGLEPLWNTRYAAGYLLTASAVLVILINATYQDGHAERQAPRILRYAGSIASLTLMPLAIISGYALLLRVRQYGWTSDRIASAACLVMASWYAIGYSGAAVLPGPWLKRIERWNFLAALLVLALIVALFSPIADPERISVQSQISRLESGSARPDTFDYGFLRWRAGRFGDAALKQLAATGIPGPSKEYVREQAQRMLELKTMYETPPPPPLEVRQNVTVYPKGRVLPTYFTTHDWLNDTESSLTPFCLRYTAGHCDAFFVDLAGDGKEELLFLDNLPDYNAMFAQHADGSWHIVGSAGRYWSCDGVRAALKAGHFSFVPMASGPWRRVQAGGLILSILPVESSPVTCPKQPS